MKPLTQKEMKQKPRRNPQEVDMNRIGRFFKAVTRAIESLNEEERRRVTNALWHLWVE